MLGPFYVGERPTAPLLQRLKLADGSAIDLSNYDSISLVSNGLPAGTTSIVDAEAGDVKYTFSAPFVNAGRYMLAARLTASNGVDYTDVEEFDVLIQANSATQWVNPSDVYALTRTAVTEAEVSRSLATIGAVLKANLYDLAVCQAFNFSDQHMLRSAICYQASHIARNRVASGAAADAASGGFPGLDVPAGAVSVTMDGMTVRFAEPSSGEISSLSIDPLAARFLLGLSVRRRAIDVSGFTSGGYDRTAEEWAAHEQGVWRKIA